MIKKQWYAWAFLLMAAGFTLEIPALIIIVFSGALYNTFFVDVAMIIGYICGIAGLACFICGKLEKER